MLIGVRASGERSACRSSRAPCPGFADGTELRRAVIVVGGDPRSTAGDHASTRPARSQAQLHAAATISSTVLIDLVARGHQYSLLAPSVPTGFFYQPEFVSAAEERQLVVEIEGLEFKHVEMRGGVARRRIVHFGWTYGYYSRRTKPGHPLPAFLLPIRERAAAWAAIPAEAFAEALVTEYPAGATIGWHRDAPLFGDVVAGISLLGASRMRFRPYVSPKEQRGLPPRRTSHEVELEARSAYLISGEARRDFEHSIPAVASLRYSITFRTLRR